MEYGTVRNKHLEADEHTILPAVSSSPVHLELTRLLFDSVSVNSSMFCTCQLSRIVCESHTCGSKNKYYYGKAL